MNRIHLGKLNGALRAGTLLASLFVASAGADLAAQSTWTHTDAAHGFEIKVPRFMEAVPTKPGDRQTLVQFKGAATARRGELKGEDGELTMMVIRVLKQEGPTTGESEKDDERQPPEMKSLTDQRVEWLNGGRTLPEFLERHELPHEVYPNRKFFRKEEELAEGRPLQVLEVSSPRGAKFGPIVRAFVTENDQEIFGIVTVGSILNAFDREFTKSVESFEFLDAEDHADAKKDAADDAGGDPYPKGDEYRDVDQRRKVRSELVDGWHAHDSDNFILVTNCSSKKMVEVMLTDLEIIRGAFEERFPPAEGADMSAVSTVRVCDGYDDYLRYAGEDMDGTGGYWAFTEEELVIFNPEKRIPKSRPWLKGVDPVAVLYHEAMHQYFHYSNRALAPASWFNEGYGEVFGGAQLDRRRGEMKDVDPNDFRLKFIRLDKKQKNDPPDLKRMLKMTQPEFYSPFEALRNYAYSWSFCYFLEVQRERKGSNRREDWIAIPDEYLKALRAATETRRKDLPPDAPDDWINGFQYEIQAEAIEAVLASVDFAELEKEWVDWMRRM